MKLVITSVAASIALVVAAPALADSMMDLAKSKQCLTCHEVDKQMTGPSFKTIAAKYKGVANADVMLADKIRKGGVAHFGSAPMPSEGARVTLTDAEAKSLAVWVLNTK